MATRTVKKAATAKAKFSLISDEKLLEMHSAMGRLRSTTRQFGLEAALTGTTVDLQGVDVVFSSSYTLSARLAGLGIAVIPAASKRAHQLATSTGAALGLKAAGSSDGVVVVFCRPDLLQREAWQEAMGLAGEYRLPILYVLLPGRGIADAEKIAAMIAGDATTAGIIAIPVDCADVVAIYRVAFESLARARRRTGATLIVCTDYALKGDANKRKSAAADPIARMQNYLENKGLLKPRRRTR